MIKNFIFHLLVFMRECLSPRLRALDRSTPIGQLIDSYLRSQSEMDDHTIHLLFSANRWEISYVVCTLRLEHAVLITRCTHPSPVPRWQSTYQVPPRGWNHDHLRQICVLWDRVLRFESIAKRFLRHYLPIIV